MPHSVSSAHALTFCVCEYCAAELFEACIDEKDPKTISKEVIFSAVHKDEELKKWLKPDAFLPKPPERTRFGTVADNREYPTPSSPQSSAVSGVRSIGAFVGEVGEVFHSLFAGARSSSPSPSSRSGSWTERISHPVNKAVKQTTMAYFGQLIGTKVKAPTVPGFATSPQGSDTSKTLSCKEFDTRSASEQTDPTTNYEPLHLPPPILLLSGGFSHRIGASDADEMNQTSTGKFIPSPRASHTKKQMGILAEEKAVLGKSIA